METLFPEGAIQTFTGAPYNFRDPDPADISLDDIAHALSNACRFGGHTRRFYSVAEHSVRVSELLERWRGSLGGLTIAGLLHDAQEAYIWDCPRPFKPLLGDLYREFGQKADAAIAEALLPPGTGPEVFHTAIVKRADNAAVVAEARVLMHHPPEAWVDWETTYKYADDPPEGVFPPEAMGWSPKLAEEAFHARAKEVGLV